MSTWTLSEAQAHLDAWLRADEALATGQSYSIGSRSLTRADAGRVAERIAFWRSEVERLTAGRSAGVRVRRAVPRDL